MANFAIVNPNGGIVNNVVAAETIDAVLEYVGPCVEVTEATGPASIGYVWDGTVFTPPTT